MSINKVILLGRLGQDPEMRFSPTGSACCTFSLATSERYVGKDGIKHELTEWHRVVVWGKLGEVCNQHLSKGRQTYVEGKLKTRSWEKDGRKFYATEIFANVVRFIGEKREAQRTDTIQTQEGQTMEDIPF